MMRVLVVGLGVTGEAVARHFVAIGAEVTVLEDHPDATPASRKRTDRTRASGATVRSHSDVDAVDAVVASVDLVVPSPGVAPRHPAIVAAHRRGVPVRAEIEIAASLTGGPEILAVTGTNGKTTVTTLVATILERSGVNALAAGNIGLPLLEAVQRDVDVVVAEVSSFQLAFTERFRPQGAALLNVGADHLDWHRTFDAYAHAKGLVFAHQEPGDFAVFNADDSVVAGLAAGARSRRVPFSVAPGARAGYRVMETVHGEVLVTDTDTEIVARHDLARRSGHDVANALAAAALALGAGADLGAARAALSEFTGLGHRLELVAEHHGVRYVDDSKATNVHATIAAVQGLHDVVLVAGGHNKGLDLSELGVLVPRLRGVVAIGDAGPEVAGVFAGRVPVTEAASMRDAVHAGAAWARPGDTVLLSPACASFDWYPSYGARGDDFARHVRDLVEVG